ncbi:hypothetical protein BT67DRAFT_44359 [Trichocladium antarcticum]|uniref:GPI anchored serine-threonine rich protein n=1 Tax=Trichocladium antarcticum TaxID=1450529 RepID=A0AAN6UIU6_9PEZI|nr:hypothetical protein BT67DRAFT_44359 [Trichocladium antarcticum]
MRFLLLPLAVLASSTLAQTSKCAADYILEACLSGERAKLAACLSTDYECQCIQWRNIITCYNNCPNDPRVYNDAGQRDLFCGLASQYATTTTIAPVPTAAVSIPASTTAKADVSDASPTASGSSKPANTDEVVRPNSAADLALNAGGILAAVAGVVAVVL